MNKEDPNSLSDQNSVLKQICARTRSAHVWLVIVQKGATVFIRGSQCSCSFNNWFQTKNPHPIFIFQIPLRADTRYLYAPILDPLTLLFSSSARVLNAVCKTLIRCQLFCLCCKSNSIMSVSFAVGAAKCPPRSRLPSRFPF